MSKLTKRQAAEHAKACALVASDRPLTVDEKFFVLEHWREDARHINTLAGAFFTPPDLARDFSIEVAGRSVIDLCAGIGTLAFFAALGRPGRVLTCIELNPDYVEVGRRIVPEATWIIGDALALPSVGRFDCAISNPPFGSVKRSTKGRAYQGRYFEYHVIEAASKVADYGVFIVPQQSAPFAYSGEPCFRVRREAEYEKFAKATGIELQPNCGIDTSTYAEDWHGVSPKVEIVCCEFSARAAGSGQGELPLERAA